MIAAIRVRPISDGDNRGCDNRGSDNRGMEVELVPRQAAPGEPPTELSLERWSLRSCSDVVMEACGLQLRVLEPDQASP